MKQGLSAKICLLAVTVKSKDDKSSFPKSGTNGSTDHRVGSPNSKAIGLPKSQESGFPKSQENGIAIQKFRIPKSNLNGLISKIRGQEYGKHEHPIKLVMRDHRDLVICNLATTGKTEPTSVKEALTNPAWTASMSKELNALELNQTWRLVPRQERMNVVVSRWVFRIKQNSDGSLERYKARLVAKGFHQKHGEDYDLTYTPVVKADTIHTILAISTSRQWKLYHLDICNAFLNENLTENVMCNV